MPIILPATLATAAACALITVWLAIRISIVRRREKIWVGDGTSPRLVARMRAQANFVEYAPFVLILLGLLELARGPSLYAWGCGAAFVVARVLHPLGMDGWRPGRMIGAIVTLLVLLLLAAECAWTVLDGPPRRGEAITVEQVPAA